MFNINDITKTYNMVRKILSRKLDQLTFNSKLVCFVFGLIMADKFCLNMYVHFHRGFLSGIFEVLKVNLKVIMHSLSF